MLIIGSLLLTIIGIFVILPNAVSILGFSGEKFLSGEIWRIVSYPFVHASSFHLIENSIAAGVVLLLTLEFDFKTKEFFFVFLGSCLLVAFLIGLIFPSVLIVGASLGLFALFGALTIKGKEYIPIYVTQGLFGMIIFLNFFYSIKTGQGFEQPTFHAVGFVSGVGLFTIKNKFRRKKRILQ